MDSIASLFKILLAKILHSLPGLECFDTFQVNTEKHRIEMHKVTIDVISHLPVLIIESECFTLKQTASAGKG